MRDWRKERAKCRALGRFFGSEVGSLFSSSEGKERRLPTSPLVSKLGYEYAQLAIGEVAMM